MNIFSNFKRQRWIWLTALLLVVGIKLWAQSNHQVERFYTSDFYYSFSIVLRFLFGWIPFSFGDILYLTAGGWLAWKLIKNLTLLIKGKLTKHLLIKKLWKVILIFASVYIVFNIFWGLNYNRKGIAWQLNLSQIDYDTAHLKMIQDLLLQKVNETKQAIIKERITYPDNKELFQRAVKCYKDAAVAYPFMQYNGASIKSSLYGWLGDYVGFTGYYNPFTGEAQVNTTVPKFLRPYITLHEMGHQLGYAKEDEANFSGYLAAANSQDALFQYSTYLDLFVYANREVFYFDSAASKSAAVKLIPAVKADILEWRQFNKKYTSVLEPAISWLYGKYLLANEQPKGLRSYNEVIATLIAYYAKVGKI